MLLIIVFIPLLAVPHSSADSKGQIPYYQLFTPMKLIKAASFIHHHHTVTATKLTFLSAPQMNARLLKASLIPPAAVDADANLVVKMVIGIDIEIGQGESDPSYVISDGQFFIGAHIRDKSNYKTGAPCLGIEGSSGKAMGGDRRQDSELPKPSESYYPGRLETRLSLSDRWGTCFVSLDGGFSREMIFQHKLNPHNGLYLEIYANESGEKVGLKYIEVSIVEKN